MQKDYIEIIKEELDKIPNEKKTGCYKFPNGNKSYWINGNLHREDGPAVEFIDGDKGYFINGNLHREDGPAVLYISGEKEYWLSGIRYSEDEFNKKMKKDYIEITYEEFDKIPSKDTTGCYKFESGDKLYWLCGKLHRTDGPAVEYITGMKEYWINGVKYSEEEFDNKKKDYLCHKTEYETKYYVNGKLHREDGPAIEHVNGEKSYWMNGKLHREDGPAIEYKNGSKSYWINGVLHREDGPAVDRLDGFKQYFIKGISYSEDEFNKKRRKDYIEITKEEFDKIPNEKKNGCYKFPNGNKVYFSNGKCHRENGPALEYTDGDNSYFIEGNLHREDGPAIERLDGFKQYFINGKLHREDGPAVIHTDGGKEYWISGIRYSEQDFNKEIKKDYIKITKQEYDQIPNSKKNGCYKISNGNKLYWVNGRLHREDGPAVEHLNGGKSYFLKGIIYSEEVFNKKMQKDYIEITKDELNKIETRKLNGCYKFENGDRQYWLDGKRHREDGPAIDYVNGMREYWVNGKLHKEDGPAVEYASGQKEYWLSGVNYSELEFKMKKNYIEITIAEYNKILDKDKNGCYKFENGDKVYWMNGNLHREDGPAICVEGAKKYYINGVLHKEDGPAVEYASGYKEYYLDGIKYSEDEFNKMIPKDYIKTTKEEFDKIPLKNKTGCYKFPSGNIEYWLKGTLHREDGPAIINENTHNYYVVMGQYPSGISVNLKDKQYWINGKRHREDGPAVDYANGNKEYYINGKRHREDGPAIEHATGIKSYYLNGINYSEAEFNEKMKKDYIKITLGQFAEIPNEKKTGCYKFPNGNLEYWMNGFLHREDGPAIEHASGYKSYWINGMNYFEDAFNEKMKYIEITKEEFDKIPLKNKTGCYKFPNGSKSYWVNGQLHREDGPAVEYITGTKEYYFNGKLHRENGPAIEYTSESKSYWVNGKLHREDGPAIDYVNGMKEYWLDGIEFSEEDFNKNKKMKKDYIEITVAEFNGISFEKRNGHYKIENGVNQYWVNGKLHREDGPAIEYITGKKSYWLNGIEFSEEDFNKSILISKQQQQVAEIIRSELIKNSSMNHISNAEVLEFQNFVTSGLQVPKVMLENNNQLHQKVKSPLSPSLGDEILINERLCFIECIVEPVENDNKYAPKYLISSSDSFGIVKNQKDVPHLMNYVFASEEASASFLKDINLLSPIHNAEKYGVDFIWVSHSDIRNEKVSSKNIKKQISFIKEKRFASQIFKQPSINDVIDFENECYCKVEYISKQGEGSKDHPRYLIAMTSSFIDCPYINNVSDLSKLLSYNSENSPELINKLWNHCSQNDYLDYIWASENDIKLRRFSPFTLSFQSEIVNNQSNDAYRAEEYDTPEYDSSPNRPEKSKLSNFIDNAKERSKNAAYRTAGRKLTSGIKNAILSMFKKYGADDMSVSFVSAFIDTDLGTSIISTLIGLAIENLPIDYIQKNKQIQKLANEFQIEGMSKGLDIVIEEAEKLFLPVIIDALKGLPQEDSSFNEKQRIDHYQDKENFEEKEELIQNQA